MTEFIVREVHFKISDLADMTENWMVGELIRCKDCKHYDGRPCGKVDWYNSAHDFCSRAERRTDEKKNV